MGKNSHHQEEPLVMTLEEAIRATWLRVYELRKEFGIHADVQMEITDTGFWVFLNEDGKQNQIKEFERWEDAASFALGRPVVARDNAAELGSALEKMTELVLGLAKSSEDDDAKRRAGFYSGSWQTPWDAKRAMWNDLVALAKENKAQDGKGSLLDILRLLGENRYSLSYDPSSDNYVAGPWNPFREAGFGSTPWEAAQDALQRGLAKETEKG